MINIISATNRNNSMTLQVAEAYKEVIQSMHIPCQLLALDALPQAAISDAIYRKKEHAMEDFGHSLFDTADEFIIVMPEYNGSFPGILKLVIDSCNPEIFKQKRFALVGVSSGRAGNLRGMDHLTDILHYLKAEVYSQKLPISSIHALINSDRKLIDKPSLLTIEAHINGFLAYLGVMKH